MDTIILKCDCKSPYQDEKYGSGNRVHNIRKDVRTCRCTVCKKEKSVK